MIFKRDLTGDIIEGARYFPVIAILGPRQSGKTTLVREIFPEHSYLSLEDIDLRTAALEDPRSFLMTNQSSVGLIIDEFQYAPQLLSYIQTIVDREQKNGYFVLTGSQNFLMNQAISQSLAGRVSLHTLLPLSVHELEENGVRLPEIEAMLYQGLYPAIYSKNIPPQRLYKNYIQTYVERDIRQIAAIGDLNTFQTFITLCAARIGQLINFTSLGNECGISDATVKRWLSILETSYIIFLLKPYHTSFGKRLVKTPKLYFYDTGLACSLLKIRPDEVALHPLKGGLFESFVIADILKWYHNSGHVPSVYFWRDKTGNEIDALLEEGSRIVPIEIKAGRTPSRHFFDGINYWNDLTESAESPGFVIFGGSAEQVRGYDRLVSWQSMKKLMRGGN